MRSLVVPLLAAALIACSGGGDTDVDDTDGGIDGDGDGFTADVDCDDGDPTIHPGADEVCNGVDDDCDGDVDTDAPTWQVWYADGDGDGFGDPNDTTEDCEQPSGYIADNTDCDDGDETIHPDAEEVCDGNDTDCSGTPDDNEALGSASSCAADDCKALLDEGFTTDGTYWVDPSGTAPFEVYCDQTTDGGGWMVVWKNHGGAVGGETSNKDLFAAAGEAVITPHTLDLVSARHDQGFDFYFDDPGREWLKLMTLYAPDDSVDHEQTVRVDMGTVTMADVFSAPSNEPCFQVSDTMKVWANGSAFLGQTDLVNSYLNDSFGLANSGGGGADDCEQPDSNLIHDDTGELHRLDGGGTLNTIRHLFSYSHDTSGRDASRCMYACWDSASHGGYYEGFTWMVR